MSRHLTVLIVLVLVVATPCGACGSEEIRDTLAEDEWLSEDKLLHVLTSAYLVGFSYRAYHGEFDNPPDNSRVFAVSVTAAAGIGKELYDMRSPRQTASWKDIAADALGIAVGLLLFTCVD
jgi:putative lipoprotein